MFRHKGKRRTYTHNLKLASILSGVAGIVNITGVLSVSKLTTNVTGHFAFFSEELILKNYHLAAVYLFYTLVFLFGAFVSSLIMEWLVKHKPRTSYLIPIFLEMSLLLSVGISGVFMPNVMDFYPNVITCTLLFSMGLQNALVTRVSQSVVRTTHLTGLFTDLGIELSQLLFYKTASRQRRLKKGIFLKLMIVFFFFLGGIIGGFVYLNFGLKTLFLSVGLLMIAIWYDLLRTKYYHIKRRLTR